MSMEKLSIISFVLVLFIFGCAKEKKEEYGGAIINAKNSTGAKNSLLQTGSSINTKSGKVKTERLSTNL